MGIVRAQDAALAAPRNGWRVYSVSANAVYYSNGLPESASFQPGATSLSSDLGAGGSARMGLVRTGERSNLTLSYTPSYTGRLRYSAWNSFNQSLFFNANRKLARQWSFGFSAAANLANREDMLFLPTVFSNVAALPTTFDNLATTMQTGRISDAQLASALTGALLVETPARNVFYGQKMLTSGLQTSLSYFYSPRLSVSFSAMGSRNQNISVDRSLTSSSYLVDKTTSGGAAVGVSYSLSPRTQLGATAASSRVSSALQDNYTTTSIGSFGRTIGRRWLVQVRGGVGYIRPVRQTTVVSTDPQPTFGGNLVFKTFSQTFLGSYDRTVSDTYGLGATSTSSASTAWRWKRPGDSWTLDAAGTRQQLQGSGFGGTTSWRGTAGLGRTLTTHLALLTQYTYLRNTGQVRTAYTISQSAVRLSVIWTIEPEIIQ